jgi:undecaprenyl diphosphate synthase
MDQLMAKDVLSYDVKKLLGIEPDQLPRHIAIIMDGNGRWAQKHGLPRFEGHRAGAKTVSRIVLEASKLGIQFLTLYSFSTENWRRPRQEIDVLMHLFAEYLVRERPNLMKYNVRMVHVGREAGLSDEVLRKLHGTISLTAGNTGMVLALALNYSSRVEITDAVRKIVQKSVSGEISVSDIEPQIISQHLYTAGIPDPDLLIRTADERRLSNFLLWQLSYSEFYIARVHWPEFKESHIRRAIRNFARRERRFGALPPAAAESASQSG